MTSAAMRDDRRLSHVDYHVWAVILCGKTNKQPYVEIGERLAAKLTRVDRRTFRRSREKLAECGWWEITQVGKHRTRYRPTEDLFSLPGVGRPSAAEFGDDWGSSPPLATVCPRCSEECRQILKVGHCRRCDAKDRLNAHIDQRLDERGVKKATA